MIERDEIFDLPSGTELSIEAALGDLERTREFLSELSGSSLRESYCEGLIADLTHVEELLQLLTIAAG